MPPFGPQRAAYYNERAVNEEAYIMSLTNQWEVYRQDQVVDVPDLPMTGNQVNDHRKVIMNGFVYKRDGTQRVRPTTNSTPSGAQVVDATTSQILNMISTSTLVPGTFYRITD